MFVSGDINRPSLFGHVQSQGGYGSKMGINGKVLWLDLKVVQLG